ncbi:CBS domain-containing protein, partial [Methylobacterium sp. C33D]
MSNDRSRGAALAAPSSTEGDSQHREPWYDRLLQALHLKPRDSLREGLEEALAEPDAGESGLTPLERVMLKNVLGLHKVRVDDVMVPRADIVAVSNDTSLGELLKLFRTAGHSRLPVYGETLDDPRGMVHIRDLVDHIAAKAEPARRSAPAVAKPVEVAVDGAADAPAAPRPRR